MKPEEWKQVCQQNLTDIKRIQSRTSIIILDVRPGKKVEFNKLYRELNTLVREMQTTIDELSLKLKTVGEGK